MKHFPPFLISTIFLLQAGCATGPHSTPLAQAFVQVPQHFLGNLTPADRQYFLRETEGDARIQTGQNLNFSYDGEKPLSGEGPLTFHLFANAPKPTVGIVLEHPPQDARHPPSTSLHILQSDRGHWVEVTANVLPQPADARLFYEFNPGNDTLQVRPYQRTPKGEFEPGKVMQTWRWTGHRFVAKI